VFVGLDERLTPDWRAEKYSDGLPVEIWCVKNSPIAEGGFAQIDHGRWGHHEVCREQRSSSSELEWLN